MRRCQFAVVVAFVAVASAQGEPLPDESAPFDDEEMMDGSEEGFLESSARWKEMRDRLQRAVDGDGLLRARRWGNIANGALLAATGPISFIVSVFGLKMSNIVLSLYVTGVRAKSLRRMRAQIDHLQNP